MANDWLTHKQLQIVRGVGKLAGDNYSAENDPIVINLMGGIFSLDTWTPNIPAVKAGGVWSDSPVSDGRQLLSAPLANVTEQMSVVLTSSAYNLLQRELSRLNSMALDCRDFWQTETQIDPVYLLWYASVGAGPQYALIYDIQISPEYLPSPQPTIRVSITIEREPAWRGIPPGANPKMWSYYVNTANRTFDINGASLADFTPATATNLITASLMNKFEWVAATYGLQTTALTKNYVEVTAAQVPGDAPALVSLAVNHGASAPIYNLYVARASKPMSGRDHLAVSHAVALNLNAGDGNSASVVTKTAGTNFEGIISNGSNTLYYYGQRTATGVDANWVTAVGWGGTTGANGIKLDNQLLRGTYAVFVRANNNSGTPTLADMKMRVYVEEFEDNATQYSATATLSEVYVPLTVNNPGYSLSYMGTLTLPLARRAIVSPLGYGLQLQETNSNLRISLQLKYLVATANRIFRVLDLILIPIDECMTMLVGANVPTSGSSKSFIDNTGYLARGARQPQGASYATNANSGAIGQELRGQPITLLPNTNQRLYFLTAVQAGLEAYPIGTIDVGVNIVPRWFGIRDQ